MKPKLLFVSTRPPFPPVDGTREHILSELRALAPFFQIDLFVLSDEKLHPDARGELEKIGGGQVFVQRFSKAAGRLRVLAHLFSSAPLQVSYFYSRRAARAFQDIAGNYQAYYCHTLRPARYFLDLGMTAQGKTMIARTFLDLNDAISLNYHYACQKATGPWRFIYAWEKGRIRDYELRLFKEFEHLSIVTDRDRDWIYQNWQDKCGQKPEKEIVVLRYGVADALLDYKYSPQSDNLVFIGNLYYPPNRQGLESFCRKIWPLILEARPEIELLVIGRGAKNLFANYRNVRTLGFIDNPYGLMVEQAAFLNPITFGAGISTKTVLSLALGIPIISTEIGIAGIEGLGPSAEPVILIDYQKPAASAETILKSLADKQSRLDISQKEKALASALYRKSKNDEGLIQLLLAIAGETPGEDDNRRDKIRN